MRAPRLMVLAGGVTLAGAEDAVVTSTGWFGADRFRVRAALAGDAARWAAAAQLPVEIRVALSPLGGFVPLIAGLADSIELDPVAGTLTLDGRDRSAALMETPTQETFANRTSSEIAALLARRHGLAADVQATATPVGRYWALEHDRLTLNAAARARTEWDLLAGLAQQEGFDVWVSGSTLHFRPQAPAAPARLTVADCTALRLDRALSFAGDVSVTVKSWHSRAGAGCVGVATTRRGAAQRREYSLVAPNLTQDAADALAARRLAELTAHELVLDARMPGELALMPRQRLQLLDGPGPFGAVFRIDEVERRIGVACGFVQTVRARAASRG